MDLVYLKNNPESTPFLSLCISLYRLKNLEKVLSEFWRKSKDICLELSYLWILFRLSSYHQHALNLRQDTLHNSPHFLHISFFLNSFFPRNLSLFLSGYSNFTLFKSPLECPFCRKTYLAKPSQTIVLFPEIDITHDTSVI